MERGSGGGNNGRRDLAAVSGAVPRAARRRRRGACASARPSVRLSDPLVAAVRSRFRAGVARRRFFGRRKRHEAMREPVERGEGRGNDRRPIVAAVSGAVPHAPGLSRGPALGEFRSGSGSCPSARPSVRLPLPMVAAVSPGRAECRRSLGPSGGPIHDRAPGARPLSVGHGRVGQHADAHLPLPGNPLLWAHAQGRIYVRS